MTRATTLAALLLLYAGASGVAVAADSKYARVCGRSTAGRLSWIDVPTYWINVDYAVERAARMHAQLSEALLPGACATRVPAVLKADVPDVITGNIFFANAERPSELRFKSPSTRELEIAVMSSHLKAIWMAHRADPRREAVCLVLEDDVDLAFFPNVRHHHPEWPSSSLSALGLARAQPDDWSFNMLMTITLPLRWMLMHEAWRSEGQATSMRAERVTMDARYGCPNKLWSAGAYLVRGAAAAELQRIWPTSETPDGALRINVSRTCWHMRNQLGVARCTPLFNDTAPAPNFVSDNCMLHHESFGPALTVAEAHALVAPRPGAARGGMPTGKEIMRLRADVRLRTYAATPPLVVSHLSNADMAHPEDYMVHNRSMATVREWWERGTVPSVTSDAVWWEPATSSGSAARARKRPLEPTDQPGILEVANARAVMASAGARATARDWRFGLPELARGELASTPFACDTPGGCRTPAVLAVDAVGALVGVPTGRRGEAFNPSLLELRADEARALGNARARFLSTVQHGLGQQCTNAPMEPSPTPVWTSTTTSFVAGTAPLNTVRVLLLGDGLQVLEHAALVVPEEEGHCVGPMATMHHCHLFRHKHASAPASARAAPWLRCVCQDWGDGEGRYVPNLSAPFVSPLRLARTPAGALAASLPSGDGGLLFSRSYPEGTARGAYSPHWYGGNGKTSQLLFEHGGRLYALWDLVPFPTVVHIPANGPGEELLARQGDVRGVQCCAQPVALAPRRGQLAIASLNLGGVKLLIHPTAGLVHLANSRQLLGVASASRSLFGALRRRAGSTPQHLPLGGTHTTHLFFALADKPPFALTQLSGEFCLPRVVVRNGTVALVRAGGAPALPGLDCNVIQTILGIVAHAPAAGRPRELLLSYGVDDCGAAVARLPLAAATSLLRPLADWQKRETHAAVGARAHAGGGGGSGAHAPPA